MEGTYINDICLEHMLEIIAPVWESLPVLPTRTAMRELDKLHFTTNDAIKVLEEGYNCARSKRKKNVREKCLKKKGKTIKIVVARSFNRFLKREAWVIIHAGKLK